MLSQISSCSVFIAALIRPAVFALHTVEVDDVPHDSKNMCQQSPYRTSIKAVIEFSAPRRWRLASKTVCLFAGPLRGIMVHMMKSLSGLFRCTSFRNTTFICLDFFKGLSMSLFFFLHDNYHKQDNSSFKLLCFNPAGLSFVHSSGEEEEQLDGGQMSGVSAELPSWNWWTARVLLTNQRLLARSAATLRSALSMLMPQVWF